MCRDQTYDTIHREKHRERHRKKQRKQEADMFEKNQEVTIKIEDITDQGQGVGRTDGFAVFVPDTLPGDTVKARLTKVKKRYAFGVKTELVEPSPDRIEKMCPYAGDCGGCTFAEYSYEAQLELKKKQVTDKLKRLGGLEDPKVSGIMRTDEPFAYRNKAVMPISTGGNIKRKGGVIENLGEPAVGFYRVRTHDVVDCEDCALQSGAAVAAAAAMREFMKQDNITAWDEKWEQGLMRSMTVKAASGTGEVMVIVRINGKGIPNVEKLIGMMDEYIAEAGFYLESFYVDNDKDLLLVAGSKVIREEIAGRAFEISPRSFYQVNPQMMEKLYDKVREYAALDGEGVLLDLYCGVGSIGLWCAEDAGYIVGIEREHQAVLDANRNAVINGIVNARYIEGAAEDVMHTAVFGAVCENGVSENERKGSVRIDEELAAMIRDADVAVIDPPRAGCDAKMIEALVSLAPERIVYVSCDPATLARDIKALCEGGYSFDEATAADMFPWTKHCEVVVSMSRVGSKQ